MKVEILNGLGEATVVDATRILVTSDDGTPFMVASQWVRGDGGEGIDCAHLLDPGFHDKLAALGVDRTVVVTRVRPKPGSEVGSRMVL